MIEDAGHWLQQERPEEINRLLLDFLAGATPEKSELDFRV